MAGPRTQRKTKEIVKTFKDHGPHRRNSKSECQECTCKIDKSLNRRICIKFESRKILKITPLSSKIHCYVKNRKGLHLNLYRSNCKSVRFLLRASPKLVQKQGNVYLSSMHKRRGYLGGVRYQNRVLSKYLCLCTCNYPFYSAYKSLTRWV